MFICVLRVNIICLPKQVDLHNVFYVNKDIKILTQWFNNFKQKLLSVKKYSHSHYALYLYYLKPQFFYNINFLYKKEESILKRFRLKLSIINWNIWYL